MTSHTLYTVGYQNLRDVAELCEIAKRLQAVVVDVRYSPHSSKPEWSKVNLQKSVPGYRWLKEAGNVLYKTDKIQLSSPNFAKAFLSSLLEESNIILMCSCWNSNTCHRIEVAKLVGAINVDAKKEWKKIVDAETLHQARMF
jgi:hypothetical protein